MPSTKFSFRAAKRLTALQRADRSRYSWIGPTMRCLFFGALMLVVVSTAPASADARGEARSQVDFGIDVAQRGLWREAIYRWEKATEIDPTYSAAFNDLAIAYEHEG